ncbi:MAG: 5'/3'-nucleotidase SurE [Thermoanaerobaculales bacterium]|jgi:5'-nucleotidase
MARPLLLISNDDGYHSEGIHFLADSLESVGEVWVVAPDRENSAVSHALTLSRPLRMTELDERHFVVDGTPTDCVTLGVCQVLKGRTPDLVVSGINFGGNMGDDVHYSGTVSAAFEAAILGVPAIAISQLIGEHFSFAYASRFARMLASRVLERGLPQGTLLNVNVPHRPPTGVMFTRLGKRVYTEGVVEDTDPRGRLCYWIGGGDPVWENIPGTDFAAVGAGLVSITPLQLDMTDNAQLQRLEAQMAEWKLEWL